MEQTVAIKKKNILRHMGPVCPGLRHMELLYNIPNTVWEEESKGPGMVFSLRIGTFNSSVFTNGIGKTTFIF